MAAYNNATVNHMDLALDISLETMSGSSTCTCGLNSVESKTMPRLCPDMLRSDPTVNVDPDSTARESTMITCCRRSRHGIVSPPPELARADSIQCVKARELLLLAVIALLGQYIAVVDHVN